MVGLLQEKQKDFKCQVIAEAAYALFSTTPYDGVTVEDIAQKAGCGKGTVYMYFKNKDHILTRLMSQGLDKLCEEMNNYKYKNNFKEMVFDYVKLQYHFYLNNHQILASWLARKLSNNLPEEWIEEVHLKLKKKVNLTASMLQEGINKNAIIDVDPQILADYLENLSRAGAISYIEGVSLQGDKEASLAIIKSLIAQGIFKDKYEYSSGK